MNTKSDNELFTRCWTGAQVAVSAFIFSMVGDFNEAQDILQEVAVILLRKFDQYDRSRSFTAWAIGVARLRILDLRRARAKSIVLLDPEIVDAAAETCETISPELEKRLFALRECLQTVEGPSRDILKMRYAELLKPHAIAERLNLSSPAIRVRLSRIRDSLRGCVERQLAGALS